jgi:hypothetical protein
VLPQSHKKKVDKTCYNRLTRNRPSPTTQPIEKYDTGLRTVAKRADLLSNFGSEWQVRVLPAVVQPAPGLLPLGCAEILQGRAVGAQLVRDILLAPAVLLRKRRPTTLGLAA